MNRPATAICRVAVTLALVVAAIPASAGSRVSLTDIETRLANIEAAQYVPFKVTVPGGLGCSQATGPANPRIQIDSDASEGTFIVTSILVEADFPDDLNEFELLELTSLSIDGSSFGIATASLVAPVAGSTDRSFDLMGTPVTKTRSADDPGGNFPHQIVAQSEGSSDIVVTFFCRSGLNPAGPGELRFNLIQVSGWKRPGETISVTFVPGT